MYAYKHPVICYPSNKLTIIILFLPLSSGGDWALMTQDQSFSCDQISAGGGISSKVSPLTWITVTTHYPLGFQWGLLAKTLIYHYTCGLGFLRAW